MNTLANKTALVTGGTSGIGLATAKLLVAQGARVVVTGRDQASLDAALPALGPGSFGVIVEVTSADSLDGLAAEIERRFETLDILVPSAGISGPTPLGTTTRAGFASIIDVNLSAVFFTVQTLLPVLGDRAAIVLVGSVQRQLGRPGAAAYAASKAGVGALARVFASELAPRGIRVNTVVPGATLTPILTRGSTRTTEEVSDALRPRIPLDRLCTPEEVASAIVYLASPAASGITAAEIVVDGGTVGAPWGAPIFVRR